LHCHNEILAVVYNFIDGPHWSGVLNTFLLEDEDSTVAAALQVEARHGVCESPVRVEGYAEIVVTRYPEAAFKEHFRMNRSTFTVCVQHFYFSLFLNLESAVTCTCSSNNATLPFFSDAKYLKVAAVCVSKLLITDTGCLNGSCSADC